MDVIKKIIITFLLVLCVSCKKEIPPIISFYYWRTTYQLSSEEKEALKENLVSKLYIRYFDIDLNQHKEPIPISPIQFNETPFEVEVVPVVYIKNRVFFDENLDIQNLAIKTNKYIADISASAKINFNEVQIDCDWSLKSKSNYLNFIETLKAVSKKKISTTIRLHQVKYFKKTKIPNVDVGVLMYYNMGMISADSLNSIYNQDIANQYIKSLKNYPLQLNYALPIFSWGIHIRNEKVVGLRSKISKAEVEKDTNFVAVKTNFYKVKHPHYRKGTYYQKDDLIKIEAVSKDDLFEMINDINDNTATNPEEIIFYDLDALNLKNYEKDIFKKVLANF